MFEREKVFGRDTASVFPTESVPDGLKPDAIKETIGALKFVSEKEIDEIKSRGGDTGGEAAASSKPLSQVLADKKQEKDDEYQAKWKLIKQGKAH